MTQLDSDIATILSLAREPVSAQVEELLEGLLRSNPSQPEVMTAAALVAGQKGDISASTNYARRAVALRAVAEGNLLRSVGHGSDAHTVTMSRSVFLKVCLH